MARITHDQAAEFNVEKHKQIAVSVEDNAILVDDVISDIIQNYCSGLDTLVDKAREDMRSNGTLTNAELDWYIMTIPIEQYYTRSFQDNLSVRADVAAMVRKRLYIEARQAAEGTVEDKNTAAEKAVMQETLTQMAYTRASSIVKSRNDAAMDILSAFKKVRSARMEEAALLRYGGDDNGV